MTLDYQKHKGILLQLLKAIYSDSSIAPCLGFKGGTAALLFYGLNRDSVDLDFDLLDENRQQEVFEKVKKNAAQYGQLMESRIKRFSILYILSYGSGLPRIKIEINLRSFGSRYSVKTLLGISMPVMVQEDMFAHKLVAMHERIGKTSRDIYDVWFFLENHWPINEKMIEKRTGISLRELLQKCVKQLEKLNNRHILDGIGEFLTVQQKDWARNKLRTDTIFLLKARASLLH